MALNRVLAVGFVLATLGGGTLVTLGGGVLATLRGGVLATLGCGALSRMTDNFWMAWAWRTLAWFVVGITCHSAVSSSPAAISV